MSLLNFPNSPATGDTYGFGVNIWEWTGSSWIKSGAITTTSGEDYTWTRPSDWLAMPSMTEGDQKIAALYSIYPGASGASGQTASGSFYAFTISGCTYVVDWGDGTTQSYSSGATAQKKYHFSDIPSSTQTTEGFRQVLMQAYPQTSGTTFSILNFNKPYSQPGYTLPFFYVQGIKELKICSDSITSIIFGSYSPQMIESFEYVGESNIKDFSLFFAGGGDSQFYALKNVTGTGWTKKGTNFSYMFRAMRNLETVPGLDCSSGITFDYMFQNSSALKTISLINTSSGKSFNYMFQNCSGLQTIPLLNTSNGNYFIAMFQNCYNLESIPLLDLSKSIHCGFMFDFCYSLKDVPKFNLESCLYFWDAFRQCRSLNTIELLNTNKIVSFYETFYQCQALKSISFNGVSASSAQSGSFRTVETCGLEKAVVKDINISINFSNNYLSPAALNEMFTNLGLTAESGATVTITDNWGASGCDRSIATAKGWTVSG